MELKPGANYGVCHHKTHVILRNLKVVDPWLLDFREQTEEWQFNPHAYP